MWTGTPAPTQLAGGRTCMQPSSTNCHAPGFPCASRAARSGPPPVRDRSGRALTTGAIGAVTVPAMVSYTVQTGETLWDVAVQHGVSMRTIKDLNKLANKEPELVAGQQLLVPASGITAVATLDNATSAVALGSTPARGLWVGSEHVRLASVGEAKELYLRQCDRGNSQNTLLVLYAPWCPHCRDMEDELERLAEGVSHESAVRVVAVDCDSIEGRMFAREVLGVAYYPSIISFPRHARTFFKYKGRQRDAESLLRFLNMTCCAREDQMWSLRPVGAHTAMAVAGGKWFNQWLPVGTSPGAMATALGFMAFAAAAAGGVMTARRRRAAAAGDSTAVEAEVVADLDSSLGRMASLMIRAMGTRMALLLGLIGLPPAAAAAGSGVVASAAATPLGTELITAAAAVEAAAAEVAAPQDSRTKGNNGFYVPTGEVSAVASAPIVTVATAATATTVAVAAAAAAAPDLSLGPGASRGLTADERMQLTRLTDDELIALVNSDPDLDKVLSRLLGDK